jgi:PAS domain S-box-containing protein
MKSRYPQPLQRLLLIVMLPVALIPLLVAGVWIFRGSVNALKSEIEAGLQSSVVEKAEIVGMRLQLHRDNAEMLSRSPTIIASLLGVEVAREHNRANVKYLAEDSLIASSLEAWVTDLGYHNILLLNASGRVIYSLANEPDWETNWADTTLFPRQLADVLLKARDSEQGQYSDALYYWPSSQHAIFVAAAIRAQGSLLGYAVEQLSAHQLAEFVTASKQNREGEETVLAVRTELGGLIISSALTTEEESLTQLIEFGSDSGQGTQECVRGFSGHGKVNDYRGIRSLAAWTPVGEPGWGLVHKINEATALSGVHRLTRWFIGISAAACLLVVFVSIYFSRFVSKGLTLLTLQVKQYRADDSPLILHDSFISEVNDLNREFTDLIERKGTAEQLSRQMEKKYQLIWRALPDMVSEMDEDGTLLDVNRTLPQLSEDDMIGKRIFDHIPKEEHEKVKEAMRSALNSGNLSTCQIDVPKADGVRYFRYHIAPFPRTAGRGRFLVIAQDVTSLKLAEEDSIRSRQMLRTVLDSIPVRVFWKDRECTYLGANRAFTKDARLESADDIIGKRDEQLQWHMNAESNRADDIEVMNSGVAEIGREESLTFPDGRKQWVRTSRVPLADLDGKITGILGLYEDITERKRIEEALGREKIIIDTAIESVPGVFYVLDREGHFIRWNSHFSEFLGITDEEFHSRYPNVLSIIHEEDRGNMARKVESAFRKGYDEVEARMVGAGGLAHFFFTAKRMIVEDSSYLVGVGVDITERQVAEEAVRNINESLEQRVLERTAELETANKELEAFSYSVSHDLRAPLRAMDGFSQAIVEDYADKLDDSGKSYLRRIQTAAQRMGAMIDGILGLSCVTRAEMEWNSVNLSDIVRKCVMELRQLYPNRAVECKIENGVTAIGDPQLLSLAIENLLGNSKCHHRIWPSTGRKRGDLLYPRQRRRIQHGLRDKAVRGISAASLLQ